MHYQEREMTTNELRRNLNQSAYEDSMKNKMLNASGTLEDPSNVGTTIDIYL